MDWGSFKKLSHFIVENLYGERQTGHGRERSLTNDEKFNLYEIKKACVSTELEDDLYESFRPGGKGTPVLGSLLQYYDDLIDDRVFELCPVEHGKFRKLKSICQLLDSEEYSLNSILKPGNNDPVEGRERATNFNEFIESLSASNSADKNFRSRALGSTKIQQTLQEARELQKRSSCLFATLLYKSSCCELHHLAKLHLRPPPTHYNDDESVFSFDAFICSRLDREPKSWHQLKLDFTIQSLTNYQIYPPEISELCQLISRCTETRQGLKVDFTNKPDDNIASVTNLQHLKQLIQPPDISLASLIDNRNLTEVFGGGDFTPRDKSALILTLAISLLHLSKDSWLQGIWRAEDIYFPRLQIRSGHWINKLDEPYLSARIAHQNPPKNTSSELSLSNPYMLSFALLILEIQAGRRMEREFNLWSTVNAAVEGRIGAYLTKEFKGAIQACLDFGLQIYAGIGSTIEEKTLDFVFRKIVKPLEDDFGRWQPPGDMRQELKQEANVKPHVRKVVLEGQAVKIPDPTLSVKRRSTTSHSSPDTDSYETASERSQQQSPKASKARSSHVRFQKKFEQILIASSSESTSSEEEAPTTKLYDEQALARNEREEKSAQTYLKKAASFTQRYFTRLQQDDLNKLPPWQQRPIRVAIVDSGLTVNKDSFLSAKMAKHRVVEKRDFIGDDCGDNYGHGTHVARTFLRVAPDAELYVARISNTKDIPENQLPSIAKAIEHAINEWDVDIICLSLGLDEIEPTLDAALEKAFKPGRNEDNPQTEKIIFAAASNGGAGEARAWPACKSGVIPVNASNGKGGNEREFNPAAIPGEENFMTLGMHIESRWRGEEAFISGTSFAAPIAAGIAANILEFARIELDMNYAEKCWLFSSRGMRSVLKRFSVGVNGYRFLCPWKAPEGRHLDRDFLRGQIMDALKIDYFK